MLSQIKHLRTRHIRENALRYPSLFPAEPSPTADPEVIRRYREAFRRRTGRPLVYIYELETRRQILARTIAVDLAAGLEAGVGGGVTPLPAAWQPAARHYSSARIVTVEPTLTNAELTVLGLLAEQPRHGYDIERTIETRGMRQWTEIAFSSIYYLLKRLDARGLLTTSAPEQQRGGRARRMYAITPEGRRACARAAREALAHPHPTYPAILVGLANSPLLTTEEVLAALHERQARLDQQLTAVQRTRVAQEPLPGFVAAIFSYATTLLTAERAWVTEMIRSMEQRDDKE